MAPDSENDVWLWHERVAVLWEKSVVRWVVAGLVCIVAFAFVVSTRSEPQTLQSVAGVTGTSVNVSSTGTPIPSVSGSPSATSASQAQTVVVHVVGPVAKPGVVELPIGSRVADAIAAVGGMKGATAKVNLARALVDGEQVNVLHEGSPDGSGTGSVGLSTAAGGSAAGALLDLNAASASQLEELPRVGPVTAAKILEYRSELGGFRSVDQLKDVGGIGEVTFAQIAPLVRI